MPIYIWQRAPLLRLLASLIAGILLQWQFDVDIRIWWTILLTGSIGMISYFFITTYDQYRFVVIGGITCTIAFISIGALLLWHKDIRHHPNWIGNSRVDKNVFICTISDPLVEKKSSFKAIASLTYHQKINDWVPVCGNLNIYLSKEELISARHPISYGSQLIFRKRLNEIKNFENPRGFDYKRYCLFQGITHQVYLNEKDYVILGNINSSWLDQLVHDLQDKILNILRKYIPGEKEKGLAEALLIGYKGNLDRDLLQSYSNTGVVHIIAISGMHIALIYWLLVRLFQPIGRLKQTKWIRLFCIVITLWIFSLAAGAQPSVLRSALMFTCLILGENISRKSSIYNSLAVSAFLLLCFNPFWLWDIGFQLSYCAVLSIVVFQPYIHNWFFPRNKIIALTWKLTSVTLAAQILSTPISIYQFHQFPNYFLFTNLVAVPLSSVILIGEILLCAVSFSPFVAQLLGKCLSNLISWMNAYVERIEALPFSLLEGLEINFMQTFLLILLIIFISYWLMSKSKFFLKAALFVVFAFLLLR